MTDISPMFQCSTLTPYQVLNQRHRWPGFAKLAELSSPDHPMCSGFPFRNQTDVSSTSSDMKACTDMRRCSSGVGAEVLLAGVHFRGKKGFYLNG
ncbi:hypothetical protein V6N13_096553 [Hibiscus sabdariffa]